MIRAALFLIGFVIGFSTELRVEAGERVQLISINIEKEKTKPFSSALLEEPRNCLVTKSECALRTGSRRKFDYVPSVGRTWTLGEKTIVVRLAADRFRFVDGSMRVQGTTTIIETDLAEISVSDDAFIERNGEGLTIVNTGQEPVRVRGRGWSMEREIPSGLETRLDLPNVRTGKTSVDLPLPLDFDKQVVREARFFSGTKQDFAERLEAVASLRREAAEVSSKLHQEMVERKLATVEAKDLENKKRRQAREAKDRELRALFRRKVLNPE